MNRARTSRQRRLAEVGDAGQARVTAGTARVSGAGLRARVEALYLAGAGVGHLVVEDAVVAEAARALNPEVDVVLAAPPVVDAPRAGSHGDTRSLRLAQAPRAGSHEDTRSLRLAQDGIGSSGDPLGFDELDPVPREVARGALRALRTMKGLLERA